MLNHLDILTFIVTMTIKGSVILLFAGVLTRLWIASSSIRHWIWSLAIAGLLILPLSTFIVPSWDVAGISIGIPRFTTGYPGSATGPSMAADVRTDQQVTLKSVPSIARASSSTNMSAHDNRPAVWYGAWPAWLLMTWLAGVVLLITRRGLEIAVVRWTVRSGTETVDPCWQRLLQRGMNRLDLKRPTRIILSSHVGVPMTYGIWRPVILLPDQAAAWPIDQRSMVLLHELIHIKRYDYITNLIGQAASILYWHNPLIWMATKRLAHAREQACDDSVLTQDVNACEYARCLLDIIRGISPADPISRSAVTMGYGIALKQRIQAILNPHNHRASLSRKIGVGSILVMLGVMIPLAALHFQETGETRRGDESVHQLIQDLESDQVKVQTHAAWSLGERENPEAVEALITSLKSTYPEVRAMAAWALGEIKDRRAVSALMAGVSDADPVAREMIIRALGEHEDPRSVGPMIEKLRDPDPDVRSAVIWALGEIGTPSALQAVSQILSDPASSINTRVTATYALGDAGGIRAIQLLLTLLKDENDTVRANAIHALGNTEDPRAIEGLLDALRDEMPAIRREAALALGKIGHPDAVDALILAIRDVDADVRAMAVWALDEINIPKSFQHDIVHTSVATGIK